jgi:hypothetical protein
MVTEPRDELAAAGDIISSDGAGLQHVRVLALVPALNPLPEAISLTKVREWTSG